ncbi:C-type lectin domain family 4 member E-like isoform X1 [Lepisosteus oculatus]|uniref:C-type lectin domain family 4 member E-like isoform X1 n=1 Tax=Lepisosteus oculatus TaxID=7918 RepID=UPI003723C57B
MDIVYAQINFSSKVATKQKTEKKPGDDVTYADVHIARTQTEGLQSKTIHGGFAPELEQTYSDIGTVGQDIPKIGTGRSWDSSPTCAESRRRTGRLCLISLLAVLCCLAVALPITLLTSLQSHAGSRSLSLQATGTRQGTPRTGHQSITGHTQAQTHTHTRTTFPRSQLIHRHERGNWSTRSKHIPGLELKPWHQSCENFTSGVLPPNDRAWIGLTDQEEKGRWRWVNNKALQENQKYWQPNQPDNFKGKDSLEAEHCVVMYKGTNLQNWNDAYCSANRTRLCERPAVDLNA